MNTKRMMYLIVLSVMLILALGAAASAKIWAGTEPGPDEARFPRQGEDPGVKVMADAPSPPNEPVKLIFIHHSCGENWLNDSDGGLGIALRDANYFVSDTNYGWTVGGTDIGSLTDIGHWWEWFRGSSSTAYMNALYTEYGQNSEYSRLSTDPGGENEIVMFKSCYPNSDLGGNPDDAPTVGENPLRGQDAYSEYHNVANAKGIYNDILGYFATQTDKLFVVITAPPLQSGDTDAAHEANARALNDWLLNDWLDGYEHDNVAVFDFYNVLTSNGGDTDTNDYDARPVGNHHYWNGSEITHTQTLDNNYSAYPGGSGGGSHPTAAGNQKATAEFVDLLNVYYNRWQASVPTTPTLTLTAPDGGESWTVGTQHQIQWSSTGSIANVSLAYSTDDFATAPVTITSSTPNDGSYTWTVPDDPSTSVRVRVASVVSPTIRDESDADFAIVSASEVETYTLNAIITPTDATEPVTYAWSPEPHSGQGTDSASYRWAPGAHQVTLAATNCGGTFTDTRIFNVGSTARNQVAASLTPLRLHKNLVSQQTMIFTGTADTVLAGDSGLTTVNVGELYYIQTYYGGTELRRSLMRWDISALPGSVTIDAATVELYRFHTYMENDAEIALHRVISDWVEGTGNNFYPDEPYSPNGATWTTSDGSTPWTTEGGDYDDTTVLDQLTIPQGAENNVWVNLDATAAVQAWAEGSEYNDGLLLRPMSGEWVDLQFYSRNAITETLRPRLVVTYTSGAPALELTAPTGATPWPVSSTQQIQWTTTGTITEVNLSYSLGDGFTPIESNVANTGSYDWTTPPTATISARVRVQSSISATISDTSAAFELYEPSETTTSTVYLPLVLNNYAPPQLCPNPLTGVAISDPITETTPSGDLVQPGDLTYLGAFRLPGGDTPPLTFAYGGNAMTFNPDGDGGDGSLFIMGHDRQPWGGLPDGGQIAEISIPAPVDSHTLDDLNTGAFIQNFANVAEGYFTDLEELPRTGMAYLNHPDTGPLIHLSWGQHHKPDVSQPSYALFSTTLTAPNLQGLWYIGEQDWYSLNGYMFEISATWADAHARGRYLGTGRQMGGGWGGMGTSLFVYRPWQADGSPIVSGTHLSETVLLLYEDTQDNGDVVQGANTLTGHQHPDEWEGGAWITTPSGNAAVLFAGNKGTGAKYWYGYRNPDGPEYPCVNTQAASEFTACRLADGSPCPASDMVECDSHTSAKGWWCAEFTPRFILYDPDELAQVAAGTMESWEPQPYAHLDVGEHIFDNPAGVDLGMLGEGVQRRYLFGGAAYDRANGRLFVLELFADDSKPVVHVWQVE